MEPKAAQEPRDLLEIQAAIEKLGDERNKLIEEIEVKVNRIKSRPSVQDDAKELQKPSISSFVDQMYNEIADISRGNDRLHGIRNRLNELI